MTRPGGSAAVPRRTLWGMSGYQWGVLFAAWLGESERRVALGSTAESPHGVRNAT